MRRDEIKRIIIHYGDNDFLQVFDWIGKVLLFTLENKNIVDEEILNNSNEIEQFVISLFPTAFNFVCKTARMNQAIIDDFKRITFEYNFNYDNADYIWGSCESLIVDLETKDSYIR